MRVAVETSHSFRLCFRTMDDTDGSLPALAIIADDLTGAADSGAPFASAGFSTAILVDPSWCTESPTAQPGPNREALSCLLPGLPELTQGVLVVNTDSRRLSPEKAAYATQRGVAIARAAGHRRFYKKIDSQFRGNVAVELASGMEALNVTGCLLAPAFPEQERTTVEGRCFVRGKPILDQTIADFLESSGFPAASVTLTDPPEYGKALAELDSRALRSDGSQAPRLLLANAWEREHLRDLARSALLLSGDRHLLAGSGGFAGALAERLGQSTPERHPDLSLEKTRSGRVLPQSDGSLHLTPGAFPPAPAGMPRNRGVLIISGSRSEEARRQIYELRRYRDAEVCIVDSSGSANQGKVQDAVLRGALGIVAPNTSRTIAGASEKVAASVLSAVITGSMISVAPHVLFVGGETAMATLRLLEAPLIVIGGEIESGIASGWIPRSACGTLAISTKAGAFGDNETLLRIVEAVG